MVKLNKDIIYSWFKSYYIDIINILNINKLKIFNFIFKYSCKLNINILILSLIKWILCRRKIKYLSCKVCLNCILFRNKNYFNYYYISNNINIDFIKKIYNKLLININDIKIIYFDNFKFNNYYVNNFLLKILEENNGKFIFIFSCSDNINIPNTLLSRLFSLKIKFPTEKIIFKWLYNKFNFNDVKNKNIILSCIRLSNNSPINSLVWIKKNILIKKNIVNLILNLNKLNIDNIIKNINNDNLEINLYILITLFLDYIKYKYRVIKYLYNLDLYYFFKNSFKNIDNIYNIFLVLDKIIFCLSVIKNINNINRNILLYDLINFLLINLNIKK